MKNTALFILGFALAACHTTKNSSNMIASTAKISLMPYPKTAKGNVSDNYIGTTVADPYRWLEDDRSAETKQWVEAQNAVTQNYLNQIPFR